MRSVIQITESAALTCDGKLVSDCSKGMCVLLGFSAKDTRDVADKMIDKILKLRIFADENGKLNRSALQVGADLLVVSNFTLYANCASSRRPDFLNAMKFSEAAPLYEYFLERMQECADAWCEEDKKPRVYRGVFGGDMKVKIVNDGPVTVILDSEQF